MFQYGRQKFGDGASTVKFPPFATDVFAASFETSRAKPRV